MAVCFRYIVNDVPASIAFYTQHLGFKLEMHPAPPFAEISRGDMHLYLTQPFQRAGGGAAMSSGEHQAPGGWNRIHLVVDDLDEGIARYVEPLDRQSPHALRQIKALLRETRDSRGDEREAEAFAACLTSEDGQEGVAAFLEKREARWTGK